MKDEQKQHHPYVKPLPCDGSCIYRDGYECRYCQTKIDMQTDDEFEQQNGYMMFASGRSR